MKKQLFLFLILFAFFKHPRTIEAVSANATLTYTISSVDAISVSGNPPVLTVNSATAGSQPNGTTDASTTYNVTTNNTSRKIYAALSSTPPSGVTLLIGLSAPTGATSAGPIILSTTSTAVVTGITQLYQTGIAITYGLSVNAAAAQVTNGTATVTFTIGP